MQVDQVIPNYLHIINKAIEPHIPVLQRIKISCSSFHFAACGSTAMGIEAAVADHTGTCGSVILNPVDLQNPALKMEPAAAIFGISLSGHSTEVREILDQASKHGLTTVFVSTNTTLEGASINIQLGETSIPRRWLPLIAMQFALQLLELPVPENRLYSVQLQPDRIPDQLMGYLVRSFQAGRMPVFIAPKQDILANMLKSQYMEFLKRPAFRLFFPEWTHDFLWSLEPNDKSRLAMLLFEPETDLTDQRFQNTVSHIKDLGIECFVVKKLPASPDAFPYCTAFIAVLDLYQRIANQLGIDSAAERSFTAK